MPPEPAVKRTVAFIYGQNLFFAARQAVGYTFPNYDFPALAASVCGANGRQLDQARFYTGIPDVSDDPFWNYFRAGKLRNLSRQNVEVFSRSLRYRNKTVKLPNGTTHAFLTAEVPLLRGGGGVQTVWGRFICVASCVHCRVPCRNGRRYQIKLGSFS